jgi:hypothetical protein
MTSSTQNESEKANYSTPVKGNPPEGKTTAVVAVMRGNSKHGYHRHHSNKHYKKVNSAGVELNFFNYSDSKWYYSKPYVVEHGKESKPQYDLILGNKTTKELGSVLDFKSKTIIIDEITLPMRNINQLQGSTSEKLHCHISWHCII